MSKRPARLVILDRDGVINADRPDFVRRLDQFEPLPGSIEAMAELARTGWRVAIATNQSGLGRGYFDVATLQAIHGRLRDAVAAHEGKVHSIQFCPHRPDEGCNCRKPAPGLHLAIGRELGMDLEGVPCVGDSARDLEAARAVGARPILVLTGNGRRTLAELGEAACPEVYDDLAAAAAALMAEEDEAP